MKKIGAFDIYKYLPQLNCGDCGEETCIAFAVKLVSREGTLSACLHLKDEQIAKLREMITPPVREITIGAGDVVITIGGEEVLYRHDLTFFNPTKIAVEIPDALPEEKLIERIQAIEDFQVEIMGKKIGLDLIAVRSAGQNSGAFAKAIHILAEQSRKPIILRSEDPQLIEAGLELVGEKKPLVYAATAENWEKMTELALRYGCPLALSSADLMELKSLVKASLRAGLKDLVLNPVTAAKTLAHALNNLAMVRKAAIKGDRELGFPVVTETQYGLTSFEEGILASVLMNRWASLLIMHSLNPAALTALLTLRQNIYTDPRVTPKVDPGLYQFGRPNKKSPVLMTTNYALTYYIVTKDIREAAIDCHLLVVDTEGLSVENALAAKRIDGGKIAKAIAEQSLGEKVEHRKLVIPGLLARLKGETEDATGWEILVGPIYSKDIGTYIRRIDYG
jgi:acetyl-CoA decarbonylase/synthase complex subunit gamma